MKIIATLLSLLLPFAAQAGQPGAGGHSAGSSGVSSRVSSGTSTARDGGPQRPTHPARPNPGTGQSASPIYYYGGNPYWGMASFANLGSYLYWYGYYSYLSANYALSPFYFDRFCYNVEPLITPEVLRLTLRNPVRLSDEMLDSIDQLETMYNDAQAGKEFNKALFVATAEQIRNIAKRIHGERILSVYDLRKEKDLYSQEGPVRAQDFQKLREMALDLGRQLKNLYNASSTASISADSYREPSMESLARGIEKVCKAIENSAKRM